MKIIIIDDDKLVCQALKTILGANKDINVLAIGNDGNEGLKLYEQYNPDIMLMDIRMGEINGIKAGEVILAKYSDAKIVYLTTFADNEYIIKALKMGAKGYLLKQDFEGIIPALMSVMAGQRVFGDEIVTKLPDLIGSNSKDSFSAYNLNEKETEIITLVANGLTNKEIAGELFLGEGTIRNYISIILEKLNLRDRTQLAIFYYKLN